MKRAGTLKKIVEAIKDMVTDANIDCSSSGMAVQAMDSAHVGLVILFLPSEGFEKYKCTKGLNIGVNFDTIWKAIKGTDNDDSVMLHTKEGSDVIEFMFYNAEKRSRKSRRRIKLLDIETDILGVPPEMERAFQITMNSSEYQTICRNLTEVSNVVTISASSGVIYFRGQGDSGDGEEMLEADADTEIIIEKEISRQFAHRYLCLTAKGAPLATAVTIGVGDETPLSVTYNIEEDKKDTSNRNSIGTLTFYVAPQIDPDD